MAAVLSSKFPDKAPEFWAYHTTILRAARNYEGTTWVAYDCQFRRESQARQDLNWATCDQCLYSEAFAGKARPILRCHHCLSKIHSSAACPMNPNMFGLVPQFPVPMEEAGPSTAATSRPPGKQEICCRFNEERCRYHQCKYLHICTECFYPHPATSCLRSPPAAARAYCPHSPKRPACPGQ